MNNAQISVLFDEYADLLEIEGANSFRTRAYRNAARTIEQQTESFHEIAKNSPEELTNYDGIGKDLAKKIVQIAHEDTFTELKELKEIIPAEVLLMLRLPGVGPKKVATFFKQLKLDTLEKLKTACEQEEISKLKGFGKKTEQAILQGLKDFKVEEQRMYLADALPVAQAILSELLTLEVVSKGAIAGSARRGKETVGDLDILITAEDSEPVMDKLAELEYVAEVLLRGPTKQTVKLKPLYQCYTPGGQNINLQLDLRVVEDHSYGAALQYFTGSKEHNVILRGKAKEHNYTLNEYGLYEGDTIIAGALEDDIYKQLNLPFFPPELRENLKEYDQKNTPPLELITKDNIKGDLHMHTTASDGKGSIAEMIESAIEKGLEYIAITDHSKRVQIANGLDEKRLLKHWKDIKEVAKNYPEINVMCGIECDILENATLDLADDVLAEADWVLAVLHFGLTQPQAQIMDRLLMAIESPHVDCIGHLTGRHIGKRQGAQMDVPAILKAASENHKMMEINAHPARLDMLDIHAAEARKLGIPIVINTDSHSTTGFEVLPWGIMQARRAGLQKSHVANTLSYKKFVKKVAQNS